jgi:DNA polymerase-3 subunit chi
MTTRVGFYHLQRSSLDEALPKLLEKVLRAGHRAVVMAGSVERVASLDALLWTYEADSWLPHGTARDGNAEGQPVFLTCLDENPNEADVLVLTDGVVSDRIEDFARCLTMFDGNDAAAVDSARALWRDWRAKGWHLTYYQQTDRGGWQEKVQAGRGPATDGGDGC